MTHERDNEKFKLGMKDDATGEFIQSEINELRFEKLNQRVMLLSIFIPIFVLVILVVTYLDIKKKVIFTKDKGTVEVKNLSQNLDSRFSNLSVAQAKLSEDLSEFTQNLEKKEASVSIKISKLQKSLKYLKTTTAKKKETVKTIAELKEGLNQISLTLSNLSGKIDPFEKKVSGQLDIMSASLKGSEEQFKALKESINTVAREKIDKTTLDLAIKLQRLKQEDQMKEFSTQLEKKISRLEKQIKTLEALKNAQSKPAVPQSSTVTQSQGSLATTKPQQKPPATTEEGDEITEQDIQ